MIVWNKFLHDARVTKEAETLSNAGYEVTVLALHMPGKTVRKEAHTDGLPLRQRQQRTHSPLDEEN